VCYKFKTLPMAYKVLSYLFHRCLTLFLIPFLLSLLHSSQPASFYLKSKMLLLLCFLFPLHQELCFQGLFKNPSNLCTLFGTLLKNITFSRKSPLILPLKKSTTQMTLYPIYPYLFLYSDKQAKNIYYLPLISYVTHLESKLLHRKDIVSIYCCIPSIW